MSLDHMTRFDEPIDSDGWLAAVFVELKSIPKRVKRGVTVARKANWIKAEEDTSQGDAVYKIMAGTHHISICVSPKRDQRYELGNMITAI